MGDLSSQMELGRVEQFMLGLLAMPDHAHRLRAIRVKKVFEEIEADYNPTFELLHVAMQGRIATVLFSHASTCYFSIISLFVSLSHTHTHTHTHSHTHTHTHTPSIHKLHTLRENFLE